MPIAKVQRSLAVDNTFFQDKVNSYVAGRATIENPGITDYVEHYGSTRAVAERLVSEGEYTNVKSAQRQVQRMLKNPDIKLQSSTRQHLGKLNVPETSVKITITGWYTYDGGQTWKHDKFSHTVSASGMRSIIAATRQGNQAGLDRFMDLYGVGVYIEFAEGVSIDVEPVG